MTRNIVPLMMTAISICLASTDRAFAFAYCGPGYVFVPCGGKPAGSYCGCEPSFQKSSVSADAPVGLFENSCSVTDSAGAQVDAIASLDNVYTYEYVPTELHLALLEPHGPSSSGEFMCDSTPGKCLGFDENQSVLTAEISVNADVAEINFLDGDKAISILCRMTK
jgi:hypothetical protein